MVNYYKEEKNYQATHGKIMEKIRAELKDWEELYSEINEGDAEVLYLTGMFSGAGLIGLTRHGARKALLFIKIKQISEGTSKVIVITGGSESVWGTDWGRHKNNVDAIFRVIEK